MIGERTREENGTRPRPRSRDPVYDPADVRAAAGRAASEVGRAIRGWSHLPEFLLPWFRPWTEQGDASLSLAAFLTAHAAPLHLPHFRPGHLCVPISRMFIVRVFSLICVRGIERER